MRLSLILPTLNERENVERFVPELLHELPLVAEILVVDDGSTDGTPEAVEKMALRDPRVRLVRRRGAPCLTLAIQEGIRATRGELVGWMDADLVILPSDYRRLVEAVMSGADAAVGSRFAVGGRIKGQEKDGLAGRLLAVKNLRTTEDRWLGVMLSWLLNSVLLPGIVGLGPRDYTSGIFVGLRSALTDVELRGDHGEYFINLWADLLSRGAKVVEVPYQVQPRRYGRSKTGDDLRDYSRRGVLYLAAALGARRALAAPRGTASPRGASESGISELLATSSRAKRESR